MLVLALLLQSQHQQLALPYLEVANQLVAQVYLEHQHQTQHQQELDRHPHQAQDCLVALGLEHQARQEDFSAKIISQQGPAFSVAIVPLANLRPLGFSVVAKQHSTLAKQNLQQRQAVVCSQQQEQRSLVDFSLPHQLQVAVFLRQTQLSSSKPSSHIYLPKSCATEATLKV